MSTRRSITKLGILFAAVAGIAALALPSVAAARDRNHDHIGDRWERAHHLSLKVNQAQRNQDRDRLVNRQEFRANDNPRKRDTDGDGISDGQENAGTIASFDGTTLVIDDFAGGTISGTVDANTEISCEAQDEDGDGTSSDDDQGDDNDDQGDDDQSGDDKMSASTSSTDDDQGDTGDDDQGDDDQGEDENDDADQTPCTTDDLTPNTVVHEAELEDGVFTGIELVK